MPRKLEQEGYLKAPKDKHGEVYVHRQVAHKAWPEDEQMCNLCGRPIFWDEEKTSKYAIIVDHKDHIRSHNDLSNLRLLCPSCNIRDGKGLPPKEIFE